MNPAYILRKLFTTPPHRLARTAFGMAQREWQAKAAYQRDHAKTTYAVDLPPVGELYSYFPALPVETLRPHADWIAGLTENYVANRFDLLGSGWVQVRYGMECRGLEEFVYPPPEFTVDKAGEWLKNHISPNNLEESRRLWKLLDADYAPIDWQRDFISGYRWEATTWYKNVTYGNVLGADVKVPWELARMQHLPQLAWAYALAKAEEPNFLAPETYVRAFRNQVLDFIATNPSRFGVNWVCTMDVAIRAANWLVGYDLLTKYGATFDADFETIFRRSIYEHATHIVANLEWNDTLRGNHYLADIVGLLFCAAYLPLSRESNAWLMLAVQEFVHEVELQFRLDGGNFEGSTAYHRLSAEMTIYGVALILAQQANGAAFSSESFSFSEWGIEPLARMAEFAIDSTKPNGNIIQFGDNDSGRFLNLQPAVSQISGIWQTNDLDFRHIVAAINGLFRRSDFFSFAGSTYFEKDIIQAMISDSTPAEETMLAILELPGNDTDDMPYHTYLNDWNTASDINKKIHTWKYTGASLKEDLYNFVYPCFGLYIWKSKRLYLAVRCGPIGQRGNGGHAHNDQLAIELNVDGKDIVVDPGTYVYTPLPERRNAYRSVRAHFAPYVEGREPGDMTRGLFTLGDEAKAQVLYVSSTGFVGRHRGYGSPVTRIIEIEANAIRVKDYSESLPLAEPQPDKLPYSPGYGKRNI